MLVLLVLVLVLVLLLRLLFLLRLRLVLVMSCWCSRLPPAQQYPLLIEKKVKNELRKGVPQTYRRLVWMRLSGAEEYCRGDYDGYYEAAVRTGLRSSPDKAERLLTSFLAGLRCQVRLCFKLDKLPEGGVQAVEVEGNPFHGPLDPCCMAAATVDSWLTAVVAGGARREVPNVRRRARAVRLALGRAPRRCQAPAARPQAVRGEDEL